MKINEKYEVKIIDDNHNGVGIAKIKELPIFIEKTITNDIVKIKINEVHKKYAKGIVESFINKEKREEIKCPYYSECGGCNLMHISKEKETKLKEKYLKKLFKKDIKVTTKERLNYRNKVTLHVKNNKLGFYKENTNELIEIKNCILLDNDINEIIKLFENINKKNIEKIIIKKGHTNILIDITGQINEQDLNKLKENKKITSIYENNKLLYGEKYIEYKLKDKKYLGNNNSFFQVNTEIAESLYDKVNEYVEESNKLLDLYCGTASIGIYIEKICNEIIGLEINEDSVECGKENIKLNNIKNYTIINKDAKEIKENFDTIVVDPPRSGLSKSVTKNIMDMNPNKIVYISCNPSTLKRDIDKISSYKIKNIEGFNMFPCTKHCETICVLERK